MRCFGFEAADEAIGSRADCSGASATSDDTCRTTAELSFVSICKQERALSSRTQFCYLIFVREFLKERFGNRSVDLSSLRAADVTGFVRRRAATIQSKRVQMMTTALRSFLRFAALSGRYRQGSCRMCAGHCQLEAVDHSSRHSG